MTASSELDPPDTDRIASEYVMGLLDGEARAAAERRLDTDAAFRAAVEQWQARLSEIDGTAPLLPAGDDLWRRIDTSLPAGGPTAAIVPLPARPSRAGLWHNLSFWRGAGVIGLAASLLLAIGMGFFALRAARQPVLVAVLMTDANLPAAVVNAFADGRAELMPLAGEGIPANHSFQVWTFPDPQGRPVPIGLLHQAQTILLQTGALPRVQPQQIFAISVEPQGGSPTGLPTGPVIMKGAAFTAL